jgi:hypothetical protein
MDIPDPTWRDSSDFDREEWLADYIRFQLHELNLNQVVMFNGPPGSGKSWTSLSISKRVDAGFDASRIVFPGVEFLRIIAEGGLAPGSAVAWDDAGLGAPARKHWDPINIAAGLVSQSFRFLKLMVSITVPDPSLVDRQQRGVHQLWLEFRPRKHRDSPAIAGIYLVERSARTGVIYSKHPRVKTPQGPCRLSLIRFTKPADDLINPYEKAKRIYLMDFYDDLLLEAGGAGGDKRSAKILLCLWDYAQRLNFTQGAVAADLDISRKTFNVWLGKANTILQKGPRAITPTHAHPADVLQMGVDAPAAPSDHSPDLT